MVRDCTAFGPYFAAGPSPNKYTSICGVLSTTVPLDWKCHCRLLTNSQTSRIVLGARGMYGQRMNNLEQSICSPKMLSNARRRKRSGKRGVVLHAGAVFWIKQNGKGFLFELVCCESRMSVLSDWITNRPVNFPENVCGRPNIFVLRLHLSSHPQAHLSPQNSWNHPNPNKAGIPSSARRRH